MIDRSNGAGSQCALKFAMEEGRRKEEAGIVGNVSHLGEVSGQEAVSAWSSQGEEVVLGVESTSHYGSLQLHKRKRQTHQPMSLEYGRELGR
mgnify:CR=1 FL=1